MVVQKWHSAAAHLFSHTVAGRLILYLVCDINSLHPRALDLAQAIVAPILSLPSSHLRECHIRLSTVPDNRFQQLAQNAACHASGISMSSYDPPSNPAATPLATLPRELRIRILEYTDLVMPRRQVFWSRQDRAFGTVTVNRSLIRRVRQDHNSYTDDFSDCWFDKDRFPRGCFCRLRHSAYTPVCNCWAPPGPSLFLISRALCEDAQFVFFSMNHFLIHDHHPFPNRVPVQDRHGYRGEGNKEEEEEGPVYPYPRLAVSEFLREVVPRSALRHLRLLHLVYPAYHPRAWPGKDHPVIQEWRSTVHWLVEHDLLALPALTLRLATIAPMTPWTTYRAVSSQERERILEAYMDLVRPLKQLAQGGLARFYADLSDELQWDKEEKMFVLFEEANDYEEARSAVNSRESVHNERVETWVMGDRYETLYADPDKVPADSDWKLYSCNGRSSG